MALAARLSSPNPQIRKLLDRLTERSTEANSHSTEHAFERQRAEEDEGVRIHVRVVRTPKARQVQHRLSPAEIEHVITAYQSGLPVSRLTELYRIDRTTVLEHLKRAGVARRPHIRKLTEEQAQEAARLYESGLSLSKVGLRFGVDAQTVRRQLQKDGALIRPRKGWSAR